MVEKVLSYSRSIVKQDTYYWCGPASTQVVLNSRGVDVGENVLALELGTTVNGTDHIGLFLGPLNKRLPDAKYAVMNMPNDPPFVAQVATLWSNIVRSVDAGYGVIANIVAPPSNYPRGVKGSVSPAYSGGTVYHYIALMGYDDKEKAVWVADSGFSPYGYWISLDQLATLIPPKGYAYATAPAPAPKPETPVEPPFQYPSTDVMIREIWEQLRGPKGRGWAQLGNLSLVDAVAKLQGVVTTLGSVVGKIATKLGV